MRLKDRGVSQWKLYIYNIILIFTIVSSLNVVGRGFIRMENQKLLDE